MVIHLAVIISTMVRVLVYFIRFINSNLDNSCLLSGDMNLAHPHPSRLKPETLCLVIEINSFSHKNNMSFIDEKAVIFKVDTFFLFFL